MLASENGHWNQNCSCSCPKFAWYLVQFVVTCFSGSCTTSTGLMFYFTFHSILLFLAMVVNKILYRSYIWSFAAIYRPCLHHYCKSVFQTTFGKSGCPVPWSFLIATGVDCCMPHCCTEHYGNVTSWFMSLFWNRWVFRKFFFVFCPRCPFVRRRLSVCLSHLSKQPIWSKMLSNIPKMLSNIPKMLS